MNMHLTQHRAGFGSGWTQITRHDDPAEPTTLGVAVLKLAAGERHREIAAVESSFLLMSGRVSVECAGRKETLARTSLFDEGPSAIHVPAGTAIQLVAQSETEFTVYRTDNTKPFPARFFLPADTANEPRGKGQVGGMCLRLVRTLFDHSNSHPDAELVLGEVITLPGRWSSYPPHHHPQPEIYHYRFDHPQGFGHAELGDSVLKVRGNDTVKILAGNDHAQCAAPGYAMYYSWVIRHLPSNPYTVPEFTEAHRWTMAADAKLWHPAGVPEA